MLDWIPTYLLYGQAHFHCANWLAANRGFEPLTSCPTVHLFMLTTKRSQGESNTRPNELQSFALPLSYNSKKHKGVSSCEPSLYQLSYDGLPKSPNRVRTYVQWFL